ncbi:hypothetical protein ACLB2K_051234 [Fragaria x ananassa]
MASSQHFIILAILAIVAPSILATDYVVGDDRGWTTNFDYQAWARGKMFVVGDNLVFHYAAGVHNVLKVNGTGFQQCAAPAGTAPLTSGHDVINLATPGRKWYICGAPNHCAAGGQKLVITVMPSSFAPSPSPLSRSADSTLVTSILANPKLAMASTQHFVILAIILAIFAPSILATDYIVGDGKGWTINFDYQAWAQGKMFYVGDNLVFNYPQGVHNVYKVNGTGFQKCAVPAGVMPLTSGNDVINLATPGRKWYICGVARHCSVGQKLLITVMPSMAPSPSPLSASSAVPSPSPTAGCS